MINKKQVYNVFDNFIQISWETKNYTAARRDHSMIIVSKYCFGIVPHV